MDDELTMKVFFYIVSVIMVVAWALCYFVYSLGGTVHFLLALAALIGMAGIFKKG